MLVMIFADAVHVEGNSEPSQFYHSTHLSTIQKGYCSIFTQSVVTFSILDDHLGFHLLV